MVNKPNHICKYEGCTYGTDGKPKKYYACNWCDATESWRSMACCREHYVLYIRDVLKNRGELDSLPDRLDMTKEEIKELMRKPISEVEEMTRKELAEFIDEEGNLNIAEAVDRINEELDKQNELSKRRKRK